jgi:hypothetical protein
MYRLDGAGIIEMGGDIMGTVSSVKCKDCGFKFTVNEGGGFKFHLLHCDRCGESKAVVFDELGDMHWRYLKGRGGSSYYSIHDGWRMIRYILKAIPAIRWGKRSITHTSKRRRESARVAEASVESIAAMSPVRIHEL